MGRTAGLRKEGYFPNQSKDVVLSCGCVTLGWPIIRDLSNHGHEIIGCENHQDGPEKWGCQKVLREATVYEQYRFYELGISAAKRRSANPPDWLRTMLGKPKSESGAKREWESDTLSGMVSDHP